jgi:hypothetical protein
MNKNKNPNCDGAHCVHLQTEVAKQAGLVL